MRQLYHYIFYTFYSWQLRYWRSEKLAVFNACVFIFAFAVLNVLALLEVFELLNVMSPKALLALPNFSEIEIIAGTGVAATCYYSLMIHNQRYKAILREFDPESDRQKHRRSVIVTLYMVASLVMLFGGAVLRGRR